MPDFQTIAPASRAVTREVKVGIVDLAGNTANSILTNIGGGVTDAQLNALRSAIGAASNGGVYQDIKSEIQRQAPSDSRAFSEPYSSVSDLGVLVFRHPNPQVEDVYLDIPCIDISKTTAEGGLDLNDGEIDAIVQAALPILNDSNPFTGNFVLFKGYYSDRKGSSKKRVGNIPNTVDPRGTPDPQP